MLSVIRGFDAQINGAVLSIFAFRRDFGYMLDGDAVIPAGWLSAFGTVGHAGQFFGAFACSWLADRIGRKKTLVVGIVLCTGGAVGEILCHTRAAFVGAKIILGVGLGFFLTIAPLMSSEIAPVSLRGSATAGVSLGIAIGQLLSNGVIKAFGERSDRWAYRGPFATQLAFAAFLLIFLPFAPESPYYLVRRGKKDKALDSIRKLFGPEYDSARKLVAVESTIKEEEAQTRQETKQGFVECFKGINRLRTGISTGVFLCQHLVGIVFVLGYSTYFFQLAGLDVAHSFDLGVGVTACGVAGNIVSWWALEKFGRRTIFLTGMVSLTTILLLIGIMDVVPTNGASWVQAGITVLYAFIYFMTIGATAFTILGEASSTALRAKTVSLATAMQAVCSVIMNFVIPYMMNPDEGNLQGKVGFIFGGLGFLGCIGSWFYVPELKNMTFEEIEKLFVARIPPRKMGGYRNTDIEDELSRA